MTPREPSDRGDGAPIDHDSELGDKYPPHDAAHDARYPARWLLALLAGVIVYFGGMGVHEAAQQRDERDLNARMLTGGDPARGMALLRPYGCARCHTIPGIEGSDGQIGPPLAGIANRMYVGGVVTNTPDNMIRWIVNPKSIDDKSAMPAVGVTEDQARDIAAYLYTLR
jgi:cytochrome c2